MYFLNFYFFKIYLVFLPHAIRTTNINGFIHLQKFVIFLPNKFWGPLSKLEKYFYFIFLKKERFIKIFYPVRFLKFVFERNLRTYTDKKNAKRCMMG